MYKLIMSQTEENVYQMKANSFVIFLHLTAFCIHLIDFVTPIREKNTAKNRIIPNAIDKSG